MSKQLNKTLNVQIPLALNERMHQRFHYKGDIKRFVVAAVTEKLDREDALIEQLKQITVPTVEKTVEADDRGSVIAEVAVAEEKDKTEGTNPFAIKDSVW